LFTNLLVKSVKGKKESLFTFLNITQRAFKTIKKAFFTTLMLAYFNLKLLTIVECNTLGYTVAKCIS
jgi:hypothetical protein